MEHKPEPLASLPNGEDSALVNMTCAMHIQPTFYPAVSDMHQRAIHMQELFKEFGLPYEAAMEMVIESDRICAEKSDAVQMKLDSLNPPLTVR